MNNYRLYSSASYTVFVQSGDLYILQLPSNDHRWIQGDDADAMKAEINGLQEEWSDDTAKVQEFTDHLLSQYF